MEKTRKQILPGERETAVMVRSAVVHTPPMDAAERDPLDLIAEEFADLCRSGKTPSVSMFIEKYPEHAEDLKELLPAVGQMESLKRLKKPGSGTMPMLELFPQHIGDYRILREIGRGGMGIVFEAEQSSLGRKVALKILPTAARSDDDKRQRFLREAQAAARLHHTNIVPVFGVGEDNGVPYYVMQFIRGVGLDDIVRGWKSETTESPIAPRSWKPIARLMAQAADALDYAHREGILHRDVKPGNLLLDTAGHLWITDFGLAKLMDEHTLTATGHVLGTFQYMAPESLRGQSDARTDVYGLGMTLYEMLTGKVPYDETNPAVLVKLIGEKEPLPPSAVDAKIPKDLETICLKAIAREPGRRYASAGEMAEDLRAYLVGRPISARRLSMLGRARLWGQRNPWIAGSAAAIAFTLALSSVVSWSMYLKAKRSLLNETAAKNAEAGLRSKEMQQRHEVEQANAKYQENLALSLEAIEKIMDIAAKTEQPGPPPPGMGPNGDGPPRDGPPLFEPGMAPKGPNDRERRMKSLVENNAKMLEQVLNFYEKFAESNSKNTKLKFDAAKAYRHVGIIYYTMNQPQKGEAAISKALKLCEEVRPLHPHPEDVDHEMEMIRREEDRRRRGPLRGQ